MVYVINETADFIKHVGTPHEGNTPHSGRYAWGSGEDPYQRMKSFRDAYNKARKSPDYNEAQFAKDYGFKSIRELRDNASLAGTHMTSMEVSRVKSYADRGWSVEAIAEKTGLSPSTVRNRLKPEANRKAKQLQATVSTLQAQVDEKKYLDISAGTEAAMGVTKGQKEKAVRALMLEGYERHLVKVPQMGTHNDTDLLVLAKPGVDWKEVHENRFNVQPFSGSVEDNKVTPNGWVKPLAIDPKRVGVKFVEDGGALNDGTIHIRPGAKDLDMGGNRFVQARIQVGDKHYLKGVAIASDDMPDGVDVLFFSNKPKAKGKLAAMKELKTLPDGTVDYENPFGSTIRQQIKTPDGKKAASAINIVNDEDNWDDWSKNLSKQFLAKQSLPLVRTQLELTRASKQAEFDEIMSLTNPTVKKNLLLKFADSADSSAEHLKAAALPRQKTHVLLPINSLKDNEVYAPNYENGDQLVLIRYPHGGIFEIPRLTVNNKNREGNRVIGKDSKVGIGITAKVAEQLSGADFDGDTVVALKDNGHRIKTKNPLKGLEGFDAKVTYGPPDDFDPKNPPYRLMKKGSVGTEMGKISNLITDMTIKGANEEELARAVRHSQVVIDAEKHKLDYHRSFDDNRISDLKKKYQDKGTGSYGASTLISRSSADKRVPERKDRNYGEGGPIDLETGEKKYSYTGRKIRKKDPTTGEWVETDKYATTTTTWMADTSDAHALSSGSPVENVYASHANQMKALGNKARLEYTRTGKQTKSREAELKYSAEVASLDAALRKAEANAPRERHAQRLANSIVQQKIDDDPSLATRENKDQLKKIKGRALVTARERTGAEKDRIKPTDQEWEAIQAGAVSEHKLQQILRNSDEDRIRELATPRASTELTASQKALIRSLRNSDYTNAEIASRLGISPSTVSKYS